MFFRGPVLGTDVDEALQSQEVVAQEAGPSSSPVKQQDGEERGIRKVKKKQMKRKQVEDIEARDRAVEVAPVNGKGKEVSEADHTGQASKAGKSGDVEGHGSKRKKRKRSDGEEELLTAENTRTAKKLEKVEKRRLKAEKKARREAKRRLNEAGNEESVAQAEHDIERQEEDVNDTAARIVPDELVSQPDNLPVKKSKSRKNHDKESGSKAKRRKLRDGDVLSH